jgi:hypothetical protein
VPADAPPTLLVWKTVSRAMAVRLVESGWEAELRAGLAACEGRLLIACPFIKHSVIERLLRVTDLDEVLVVTRFSLADFARGVSDIAALQELVWAGADLRGVRGLHAKVFVFGDRRAIVTSANLTESGLSGNVEFGCVSDDARFVSVCAGRVRELHTAGEIKNDEDFEEWTDTVDRCLRHAGRADAIDGLPDYGAPPGESASPDDAPGVGTGRDGWIAESRQAFVKFAGRGHERAELSVAVLDEIRRSGAFMFGSYPTRSGHPTRVKDGDTLFMSRMVEDGDMRIIGRAIAIAHDPERDVATAAQISHRRWLRQWGHLVCVHHPKFVAGTLANGVSLDDLVEELGPLAFASTKKRLRAGEKNNIQTRRIFSQKPDARLSEEGFAWMTEQFEAALAQHGSIPDARISRLS